MTTEISIHALLAESDLPAANLGDGRTIHFYPRSPCGERPLAHFFISREQIFLSTLSLRRATKGPIIPPSRQGFLSTLSLRRATRDVYAVCLTRLDFYPRSPCGERQCENGDIYHDNLISIHALLAESDIVDMAFCSIRTTFLSTLSLRRATIRVLSDFIMILISIHALLAESDIRH